MTNFDSDTIAAIATAPGRGGVGIVRISGPASRAIATEITDSQLLPRYAPYGAFYQLDTPYGEKAQQIVY